MRQEWLKDLLAVAEAGSLQKAAAARGVTQPAFSRRLRQIETQLGTTLFDRSHRPTRMLPHVQARLEDIRDLSDGMNDLVQALRRSDRGLRNRMEIACQHAIAISVLPSLMKPLRQLELHVRVRSANREDCLAQLLVGQVDLAIVYGVDDDAMAVSAGAIDRSVIADDHLIPVFPVEMADALKSAQERGELPIVAYPRDVFLGGVFWRQIAPHLPTDVTPVPRIETALTPAAKQFALSGLGVAWLPRLLVAEELRQGSLTDLSTSLHSIDLNIVMMRRVKNVPKFVDTVWRTLA